MYSIKIRDHIMIAHSLQDKAFGPAQRLHGATYIVDVTFSSEKLNHLNIVIDIDRAHKILNDLLEPMRYRNLDEMEEFRGRLTTTEFLARHIHDNLMQKTTGEFNGRIGVTLGESHIAWASYSGGPE